MRLKFLLIAALGYPVVASAFMGLNFRSCDDNKAETTPTARFEFDELSTTVFDTVTKLTWKRCSEGQYFSAGRCEGNPSWWGLDSAKRTFSIDGEDWRLPTKDELASINEEKCVRPSINLTVFPDTPAKGYYWSSTIVSAHGNTAWSLDLGEGKLLDEYDIGDELNIRLVKGGAVAEQWRARKQSEAIKAELLRKEQEVKAQEEKRRRQEELENEAQALAVIQEAQSKAVFLCRDTIECSKAFSLTQIYVSEKSDMKIQVSTDTIVETYTPVEPGKIGIKAIKTPGKGTSASISLMASCKEDNHYKDYCRSASVSIYTQYPLYMNTTLKQ